MGATPEEKQLIQKARHGDVKAFESLIAVYDTRIMGLLMQMLGHREDARDAYQEVFMRVWTGIGRFREDADFFTWVYRIAVNTAITLRKKRTRHRHSSLDQMADNEETPAWHPVDTAPAPDRQLRGKLLGREIEKSLDTLSLQQRAAFILRYYQEFKILEIAEIMGCSDGTVKNYLFRATRKLRRSLRAHR